MRGCQADELFVDLEKPTHKGEWKIDAAPDADAVKVEISGVGGLKFTVQPSIAIPAGQRLRPGCKSRTAETCCCCKSRPA